MFIILVCSVGKASAVKTPSLPSGEGWGEGSTVNSATAKQL